MLGDALAEDPCQGPHRLPRNIGIGASPACDGQILVTDDALGLFSDFTPKFVKRYAELGQEVENAVKAYADDVRAGAFPVLEHCFGVPKDKTRDKTKD